MHKIPLIAAAVVSLGFLLYTLVTGEFTGDCLIFALIIFGAVFAYVCSGGSGSEKYDGRAEAMRYKTDDATGEKIAQLKNLNRNLGNDPTYTDDGYFNSHLYGCSQAEGELINQATMAARSLGEHPTIAGGFYSHLYNCSEADGEFISQMEALNKGLESENERRG